jgi:ribosome biogenesis ATPase
MPSKNNRRRGTLGQGLDREVYQVVRSIIDEQTQYGDTQPRLSFAYIYDNIKASNSSLNRKPKKLLEDSIERVLESIEQDAQESKEDLNRDFEDLVDEQGHQAPSNGLNKSVVAMWSKAGSKASTPLKRDQEQDRSVVASEDGQSKKRQANGEPVRKKRKEKADIPVIDRSPPTHVNLADLGGVDGVIQQFEDLLVLPMTRPEIYSSSRVQPPRGVLIHGPPGCGKTMIANAFAAELSVNFISISAPSIVSGMSGESEKALREHFEEAKKSAPCLIFIDEIDAITPKRESAQREMEKRIVAQLLTCMDDLALEKTNGKPVIVLAATNRPDSLDAALRRGGRFDKEINMSVPSEPVREQILRALTRHTNIADDVEFALLAKRTPGFVGADLNDLVSTAGAAAIKRYLEVLKASSEHSAMDVDIDIPAADALSVTSPMINNTPVSPVVASLRKLIKYTRDHPLTTLTPTDIVLVTNADFLASLPQIQPSALREGFATIPSTTFADIGALSHHRAELQATIILPILNPPLYASVGISTPSGLLLWGPPGCGKTLLAKAVANESKANFISVKGPELLNKYVGESERAVRQVFNRARSSVPVVIFFDELDALVPRREGSMSEASARVVNTLLTELDGVGGAREGIYVLAATNRPDIIDPAMLRPGRLETLLYVGLPAAEERVDILRTLLKRLPNFGWTEEIADVARKCDGYSGADLNSLLRRAGYAAIKRGSGVIELGDFEKARGEIRRSVQDQDMKRYDKLRKEWGDGVI